MLQPIFITGIGTGVGKTLVASILAQALEAEYWKPVQAGYSEGTDSEWMKKILPNASGRVHPELYKLKLAASPHIAAREEGVEISLPAILARYEQIKQLSRPNPDATLIIEGAGGLLVPLNDKEWIIDLIQELNAPVVIVSRNYLGSINHSLLTAWACQSRQVKVLGWVFNDRYMDYESEIVKWTGIHALASLPFSNNPDQAYIQWQAGLIKPLLNHLI
jgi:dethiobiotin synthetase